MIKSQSFIYLLGFVTSYLATDYYIKRKEKNQKKISKTLTNQIK